MSLKIMMNNKKLELLRKEFNDVETRETELEAKSEEITISIDECKTDEEIAAVSEEMDNLIAEKEEVTTKKKDLKEKIEELEKENEEIRSKKPKLEGRSMNENKNKIEIEEEVIGYIRSKGSTQVRKGVVSSEVGVLIPKEITYTPKNEIETVVDLSNYVSKTKVTSSSGTYPILKRNKAKLVTVAELENNPELGKPQFNKVDWSVETYRGALPISQEAIDDSQIDILGIIEKSAAEIKVNTVNDKIAGVLKTFTPKEVTNIDDIKKILNVELDTAYLRTFIVSQSFYQAVDTLKDKNGKYILNDNIAIGTGKLLFGHSLIVVNDELLGNKGEAKAFIGDLEQAVLYADRAQLGVRWADNGIYGQHLMAGLRFDIKKADEHAGFFVTLNLPQV